MIPNNLGLSKLEPYALPAIILLVGVGAFGLGRLSAGEVASLRIVYPDAQAATPVASMAAVGATRPAPSTEGEYVASKNGSKYYLATCSAANRIKQENRVFFVSVKDAEAAGYEPAANCPGL